MKGFSWLFASVLSAALAACSQARAPEYPGFDALKQPRPAPPRVVGGVEVSEADYQLLLRWGAEWFRDETFGGERMVTDVVGMLNAPIEVPCPGAKAGTDCYQVESSLPYVVAALDALDGTKGNLYTGNGGPDGSGYTHDLTIRFPPGSRLHGLPLPEELHTGLDVEAGSAWPIGIWPVAAKGDGANAPYVWNLPELGAGPVNGPEKVRIGITCALCHYSLDVDWDGVTDLKSARLGHPTAGSPFRPEHSWAVGNQDLKVGWLFAMSQNPLVGFMIFSGPIGDNSSEDAMRWVGWVKDNYQIAPKTVVREVVRGMMLQPRGYADVTSNARYNASQFSVLYTQHYWPSNTDGAVLNGTDRNSVVWTTTLDFSGLVGLARDRGGASAGALYWEPPSIYGLFTARELAELMVRSSPAALHDPRQREILRDDILGVSDGVPGLLDADSVFVMQGPTGVIPDEILNHPANRANHRIRRAEDFGGDGPNRGPMMALLGIRARSRPHALAEFDASGLGTRYPKLNRDDLMGEAVNVALDWQPAPPNVSQRLAGARDLVATGYEVFKAEGCATCHRGPFYTDNVIHRHSARRAEQIGIASPSTSPWRSLGRGSGPAILSDPERTFDSRPLYLYVAPTYDPATGAATSAGGIANGLLGEQVIGYKTAQLRYLWGSAPYLHDGGVGVAIAPTSRVAKDSLRAVLKLPPEEKVFGMGRILAYEDAHPGKWLRADAALSLQALLLESERRQVLDRRHDAVIAVPGAGSGDSPLKVPAKVSAAQLGIEGIGHEFYLDDVPGGERVTALVAFLLALDDNPGDLPQAR
jgi:hypothetical protein